ncbi:terpene synthase family protein [Chitinophaga sp. 22536]|uniref:terpene synthase family protein n=1 Tax=unclassified Chitinophaga TaxID=2619133 RepID=UPI003F86E12E
METTTLPGLYCPFPGKLNPLVEKADRHTAAWVRKFGLDSGNGQWQLYQEQKFSWMVARMFPNANLFRLSVAADFNTLLFLWDDEIDRITLNNPGGFEALAGKMIGVLKGKYQAVPQQDPPLLLAMQDIWLRMVQIGPADWQQRFTTSLHAAFMSNSWRMQHVTSTDDITLEDYMLHRPGIGGANFFLDLAEIMEDVFLPASWYADSLIKDLGLLTSRTICWANDLFSYTKELEQGDELNLVMMIKNKKQVSLEQAVHEAAAIHDDEIRQFLHTADVVLSLSSGQDYPLLDRYILMLEHMMEGNISWSTRDTSRYGIARTNYELRVTNY